MTSALTLRVQARSYERRWWILTVLCFSLLVIVLDNTILNVAIPTIVARPRRDEQPAAVDGRRVHARVRRAAAHRRQPRRPLRASAARCSSGCVIFGLGSLAVGVRRAAPTQLIATRAFMGIGGAFIMPATLSIITNVFPAARAGQGDRRVGRRRRASRGALGPITGGFLLEHFYWGSVFLVNIPIVVDRPARRLLPHPRRRRTRRAPRLDPIGAVLSIVGLVVAALRDHRGARRRAGPTARSSMAFFASASVAARRVLRVGDPHRPPDARRQASSRTRASPRRATRSC